MTTRPSPVSTPFLWGADRAIKIAPSAASAHLIGTDPEWGPLIEQVGHHTLAPPTIDSPIHYLQRSIVFQQLTGKAASTIYDRFVARFDHRPPTAEQVLATREGSLRRVGLSTAKAKAIRDLARHEAAGKIPARDALYAMDPEAVVATVSQVKGVGRWTAEMLLIFYLGHADTLPLGDLGIRKGYQRVFRKRGLPAPRTLERHGRRWSPYRSVASWYLWRALELPPG